MMRRGNFKNIVPNTGIGEIISKESINSLRSTEIIWWRVLSSYSVAQLSNPGDKEAALSGILKVLEGIFDDTYVAGLWRKGLPAQLSWRARSPAKSSETYRAPSWSWLSINGGFYAYSSATPKETDRESLLEIDCAAIEAISITRLGRVL